MLYKLVLTFDSMEKILLLTMSPLFFRLIVEIVRFYRTPLSCCVMNYLMGKAIQDGGNTIKRDGSTILSAYMVGLFSRSGKYLLGYLWLAVK